MIDYIDFFVNNKVSKGDAFWEPKYKKPTLKHEKRET